MDTPTHTLRTHNGLLDVTFDGWAEGWFTYGGHRMGYYLTVDGRRVMACATQAQEVEE